MSIFLGKQEVSSYIHTSSPEVAPDTGGTLNATLVDMVTDGRTSIITPPEGADGISRLFIDNTDLLLAEKNLKILMNEYGGITDLFYDISSKSVRDYLFYSRTNLKKLVFRNAESIDNNACYNMLDLEEVEAPKCTNLYFRAFDNSYRLLNIELPKVGSLSSYAFYNSCYHPSGYKTKMELGHLEYIQDSTVFQGCGYLEDLIIGDANTNDFRKDYNDKTYYYPPYEEEFEELPANLFKSCSVMKSLVLPEVHGKYTLKGDLFEKTPNNFKIYVDQTMLDSYKNDATWATYKNNFERLENHPYYNYDFEWANYKKCYRLTRYGNFGAAVEGANLSIVTPRGYRGYNCILDGYLYTGCVFDKLKIGTGTYGIRENCFNNCKVNTLEFEDFTRLHEIENYAFWGLTAENVILNCSITEYFNHIKNDDIGYVYSDDSETTMSTASKLDAPWGATHIYTYPGFEITDLFIPASAFETNHQLGWGSMRRAHFNNIYLNRNINTIWNYAFDSAYNTNIYIPKEVTTVKQFAFDGLYNSHIYCEAESKPSGWESGWDNYFEEFNVTVHWGHKM